MATSSQIIAYLQECYRADNREFTIFNLYSKKVENLYFWQQQEELLSGIVSEVAMDQQIASPIHRAAMLYRKDKSLLYV